MMNQKRGLTDTINLTCDGDLWVPNNITENLKSHFNLTILVHYICFDINLDHKTTNCDK